MCINIYIYIYIYVAIISIVSTSIISSIVVGFSDVAISCYSYITSSISSAIRLLE